MMSVRATVDTEGKSETEDRRPSGKRSAISTSKIRNTRAIRKNRSEKGARAFLIGSNPHSKGVSFSRSLLDFILVIISSMAISEGMRRVIRVKGVIRSIRS